MPQDIPFEASETLVFVPDCLKFLGTSAPSFVLGTPTGRERRYIRRLYVRHGVQQHTQEAIREEVLAGLRELWARDTFDQNSAMLKHYWQAVDDFALASREDPELVFEYDAALAAACKRLPAKVAKHWPPLGEMLADNADFSELTDPIHVAVVLKSWTGLDVSPTFDEGYGYITTDCAELVQEALEALCRKHKIGTENDANPAWTELVIACYRRVSLDEEEAKNSESPGQSETNQARSNTTKARASSGKSRASANSRKTPAAV